MKKITKFLIIAVVLTLNFELLTFNCSAQDIHFSQNYFTPLELNPANAGSEYDIRAGLNYRTQWGSVTEPFVTMMAGYDMNFKKSKTGFFAGGIHIFNDKAGDSKMNQTQANLAIAYHVYLNEKNTLGAGFQGGYFQRSIDMSNLTWGSQYDGLRYDNQIASGESTDVSSVKAIDFSSGINWTYRKGERYMTGNDHMLLITGVSIQHINNPKTEYNAIVDDPLYYRWIGHFNGIIGVPNSPISFIFKEASKYTGNMKGGSIGLGGQYRLQDAFVITSFVEIANYTLGVSYDLNTSDLSSASKSYGAFEVALRYVYPSPFAGSKNNARFR
ncbi:MAG: PorP/SprF family type IX secretion system membrane protein [Bacteroidetes bacterium]|nr:PorP/SprF family type IX secretion system membrane protein [Bacteroidota bacterium]